MKKDPIRIVNEQDVLQFVQKCGFLGLMAAGVTHPELDAKTVELRYRPSRMKEYHIDKMEYYMEFFPQMQESDIRRLLNKSEESTAGLSEIYRLMQCGGYAESVREIKEQAIQYFDFAHELQEVKENGTAKPRIVTMRRKIGIEWVVNGSDVTKMCKFDTMQTALDYYLLEMATMPVFPIGTCKRCGRVFYKHNIKAEFCSPQCRNVFNVLKSRRNAKDSL